MHSYNTTNFLFMVHFMHAHTHWYILKFTDYTINSLFKFQKTLDSEVMRHISQEKEQALQLKHCQTQLTEHKAKLQDYITDLSKLRKEMELLKAQNEGYVKQTLDFQAKLNSAYKEVIIVGGTSGLLVKVLACNRKVAGSSPTRVRLFSPMRVLSSTLKNEEVFITASFGGDVKPLVPGSWLILATCAILASSLSHIWSKHL